MLTGVDVSSFQGPPADWKTAAGQIGFAAVKITELMPDGTRYVNPDAAADWAYLGQQGKGRIAYAFGHPAAEAGLTAAFFAKELRAISLASGDGICLDHEVTDGRAPGQVSGWAQSVLKDLAWRLDRTPLLYTFRDFAAQGNCDGLGSWPLWIADPSSPPGHPVVPPPWTSWVIHQTGARGQIDRDLGAWPDIAAMQAAVGRRKPPPLPPGRHRADGTASLLDICRRQDATPAGLLFETGRAEAHPGPLQQAYIDAGDWSAIMPAGMILVLP